MFRSSLIALFFFALLSPACLLAGDDLTSLEAVVVANQKVQPGLNNYLVTVETSRIEEMMTRLTTGMPSDVKPPPPPVITKFWQRDGQGIVYSEQAQIAPYVEKMVAQISSNLAIELNEILLPADQSEQRLSLVTNAEVKSSEVALAGNVIQRLEITFKEPTDLNEAFYLRGIRLPQKQIKSLTFDINVKANTVSELSLVADNGLQLTMEVRYLEVVGGYIPERFQITSPDGKVDDNFEVKFVEIDGFKLPSSMVRVIRRPDLQEDLEVLFKDYRVNQPIPEDIRKRLESQ